MKKADNKSKEQKSDSYIAEHNRIINSSNQGVVVHTEWNRKGDVIKKFSMYDESYVPIKTLGNTTSIKDRLATLCPTGKK